MGSIKYQAGALAIAVILLGAALWYAQRKLSGGGAAALGEGAVKVADDLVRGVVVGAGKLVGVPETSLPRCAQALADGRFWDASFDCPAKDFVTGVFSLGTGVDEGKATSSIQDRAPVDRDLMISDLQIP